MSATRNTRLSGIGETPQFRRAIRLVAWAWTALAAAIATAFTFMATDLPTAVWYVFTGGRTSGPQLLLVPTVNLAITAWVVVVVAVAIGIIQPFVKGAGAPWILVIRILIAFGTAPGAVVLLGAAIGQVGLNAVMPRATAESTLLGSLNVIGVIAIVVGLGSLIGIPYLVASRQATKQSHSRASRHRPIG